MLVELILLERVEKLGQMGQLVKVKPGYARNYLLPQKKALRATKENLSYFESRRAQLEANNLQRRSEATEIAGKLEGLSVVVIRQAGESGQLYGSVSARDIADAVTQSGFTIEKRQVVLERPIKTLGMHSVRLVLHPEVSVTVTANVAQSAEEAEMQAKGIDPLRRRDEEEEEEAARAQAAPAEAAAARPHPTPGTPAQAGGRPGAPPLAGEGREGARRSEAGARQ
jgi:large subunit ribosomal protein L9